MKQSVLLAAVGVALLAPRTVAAPAPGEVMSVSVIPGPGAAHVVIDVRGSVGVQDFTLADPARLVIDVTGAQLRVPALTYDGANRGGIVNVRFSQFRPDVVRIVLELESLKDYHLEYEAEAIRVAFGTDRRFAAWSSVAPDEIPLPQLEPMALTPETTAQQSQQPLVTVTWDSASVSEVMAGFAAFSGKTIVLGRNIDGIVFAEIKNQPWDVAFQAILESQGLTAEERPVGIIRVQSQAALAARDSLEPLRTTLVDVNFARAGSMAASVAGILSARGRVTSDTATNSLIITDVESRINDAVEFMKELDRPTPQVSIQAKLIFVDRTDIEELGVRYDLGTSDQFFNKLVQRPDPSTAVPVDTDGDGVPDALQAEEFFDSDQNIINLGGNALSAVGNAEAQLLSPALELIFSTAIGNFNLTTFVNALQRVELADLQAEPLISTADNSRASILVGERTPIRQIDVSSQSGAGDGAPRAVTTIVPTGIRLDVTPHVTNSGQVLMTIHAENSSIRAAPADVGFTFQTQEADNTLLVNDGETAVIGGLTVTQVTVAKSGIPFLVDLPIIGRIFGFSSRREQRRDLLILVTPHIIKNPGSRAPASRGSQRETTEGEHHAAANATGTPARPCRQCASRGVQRAGGTDRFRRRSAITCGLGRQVLG